MTSAQAHGLLGSHPANYSRGDTGQSNDINQESTVLTSVVEDGVCTILITREFEEILATGLNKAWFRARDEQVAKARLRFRKNGPRMRSTTSRNRHAPMRRHVTDDEASIPKEAAEKGRQTDG
jgi:hypothetical protein